MSDPHVALEASYAYCRRVARRARSSFYPSFLLLEGSRRRAMEAIYAFMRLTDDLADRPQPTAERRAALVAWRQSLEKGIGASVSDRTITNGPGPMRWEACVPSASGPESEERADPFLLLPAVADTVRRFRIPPKHLVAVIDGVEMDLGGRRYATFAELAEYCEQVASSVGLACIHVWGFRGEGAFEPARRCGIAFQLTNILRDLQEDLAMGRVYLPADELAAYGLSAEELARGTPDARFDRLMAFQIERARQFYREGAELFDWLEPAGQRVFGMMCDTYYRLLGAIDRQPRAVLHGRVRLSGWQKLRIALRWALGRPRRSMLP